MFRIIWTTKIFIIRQYDDDDEADFNTFLHCGVDDEAIECLNYNNFMANATQTFIICT